MARDISQLHPTLQEKIAQLKVLCEQKGLVLGIGECFRSVAEQDALYAQGRTKSGSIVTNAKGSSYSSQHQWGIAVDFFKNVKGHAYDDSAFFSEVGKLAKSIGLAWGGDWKGFVDKPHLYLPDWGSTTSQLKKQYGTFENFKKTWPTVKKTETKPSATVAKPSTNNTQKVSDTKMPTIKFGSKGKAVKVWQAIVGAEIDGDFGANTKAATIAFQKKAFPGEANKKEWDGIVGTKTWKAGLESL